MASWESTMVPSWSRITASKKPTVSPPMCSHPIDYFQSVMRLKHAMIRPRAMRMFQSPNALMKSM